MFIDRLTNIQTLRKAAAIDPKYLISDFKPGILDIDNHPVIGASAAEGQDMSTRLEHPICLFPQGNRRYIIIPLFTHELEAIRGICYDGIYAVVGHLSQDVLG